MLIVGGLNELDMLLIMFLLIGALLGLVRGAVPQIISVISIWLSLVISLWLYLPLSRNIIRGVFQDMQSNTSDMLAFLVLFAVFVNAIGFTIQWVTLGSADEKEKKGGKKGKKQGFEDLDDYETPTMERYFWGPLNVIVGLIMGTVLTTLWMAIVLGMLQFVLQDSIFKAVDLPGFVGSFALRLKTSSMVVVFNQVLYWVFVSISLFVPKGGDATILNFIINTLLTRA